MKVQLLLLSSLIFISVASLGQDSTSIKKENSNLLRLEGLHSACMANYYSDKKFCRKKVLKQCRESLHKKECKRLLSQIEKKSKSEK